LERSSENNIERQALEDALTNLSRIKKNTLKFD
jgi:hypothetical protein